MAATPNDGASSSLQRKLGLAVSSTQHRVASPSTLSQITSNRSHAASYTSSLSTSAMLRSGRSHQRMPSHSDEDLNARSDTQTTLYSEWSYFGVDIIVENLSTFYDATKQDASNDVTQTTPAPEPQSPRAVLSCNFGGNRWKVELGAC